MRSILPGAKRRVTEAGAHKLQHKRPIPERSYSLSLSIPLNPSTASRSPSPASRGGAFLCLARRRAPLITSLNLHSDNRGVPGLRSYGVACPAFVPTAWRARPSFLRRGVPGLRSYGVACPAFVPYGVACPLVTPRGPDNKTGSDAPHQQTATAVQKKPRCFHRG